MLPSVLRLLPAVLLPQVPDDAPDGRDGEEDLVRNEAEDELDVVDDADLLLVEPTELAESDDGTRWIGSPATVFSTRRRAGPG